MQDRTILKCEKFTYLNSNIHTSRINLGSFIKQENLDFVLLMCNNIIYIYILAPGENNVLKEEDE